jgi:hypothetical protein
MQGCQSNHVICESCLRMGLRSLSEDILTTSKLLCGCFSFNDIKVLTALANKADLSLKRALEDENASEIDKMQLQLELEQTRGIGDGADDEEAKVQGKLYSKKLSAWYDRVLFKQMAPL